MYYVEILSDLKMSILRLCNIYPAHNVSTLTHHNAAVHKLFPLHFKQSQKFPYILATIFI